MQPANGCAASYMFLTRMPGVNRWPHSGHLICSESMRQILSGGIAYPHFVQIVLSAALTFSRLIFGFRGIFQTWHLDCSQRSDIQTVDF